MGSDQHCCCGGLSGISLPNWLHGNKRSRNKGFRSHLGIELETSRTEGSALTDYPNPSA